MEFLLEFGLRLLNQLQTPTIGFLVGGMLLAAFGSKLTIPSAIYQFIVFMLLMKIGLKGGMEIRNAELSAMLLPLLFAGIIGIAIVLLGNFLFSMIPSVKRLDGIATAGLFGAVSASTLAAAMVVLEQQAVGFEAWVPALYPFMDIPALVLAIVLANVHQRKNEQGQEVKIDYKGIIKDSLRGSALSALLLGLLLGLVTNPERVYDNFYEPLFRGFLSILLLIMGMEAYERLHELRRVAHWYIIYAVLAPITHGLLAFGLGYVAHITVGFSPGGVVLLAVMAASSSDISGPPTLRSAIPEANPSSYIGSSTSIGTPVAIAVCIPLFVALAQLVFEI
jgi:hypothetical protein